MQTTIILTTRIEQQAVAENNTIEYCSCWLVIMMW